MDKEKFKTLTLTKQKIADVEGEHRVTFVASTATEDRDYEHVAIGTFRLPLKGGGHVRVSDLPEGGADNIDIPFLANHDLWEVEKVLGSVRKAWFEDGSLIFECGFSSREYAQDKYLLLKEGHLDNAFSIQFRDYEFDYDTNTNINGEIVEVSLVTRGSNMDAQVIAVKSLKGKVVEEDKSAIAETEEVKTAEVEETAVSETAPATEEAKEEEKVEETEPETEAETEETNTNEDKEKIMSKQTEIAKTLVKEPVQAKSFETNDYLKTDQAVIDYAKIAKTCGGDAMATKSAWNAHCASKGLSGDMPLPEPIEQTFFKAWDDVTSALSTFRRTRAKVTRMHAFTTTSRAQGHKKGEQKADQNMTLIARNTALKVVYKKLPLDWIDIVNDGTGELYRFRTQELYDRLMDEIIKGAIVGDGRTAPEGSDPDYRVFDGVAGLYSIASDITNSTDTTNYAYSAAVATKISNTDGDDLYDKIVKTKGAVKSKQGSRKVIVVAEGSLDSLLLMKNENGGRLYPVGTNFEELFGVRIIELPASDLARSGYDVICYREGAYTLSGPEATTRNWFDGNINQDVMLTEQPVAGSLEGYKVAAGYVSANASA